MSSARVNRVFMAVCDREGTERGVKWVGGSAIIDENGWLAGERTAEVDLTERPRQGLLRPQRRVRRPPPRSSTATSSERRAQYARAAIATTPGSSSASGVVPSSRCRQRTLTPRSSNARSPRGRAPPGDPRDAGTSRLGGLGDGRDVHDGCVAEPQRLLVQRALDSWQEVVDPRHRAVERDRRRLVRVPAEHRDDAGGEIAGPEVEPERHAFQLPVGGTPAEPSASRRRPSTRMPAAASSSPSRRPPSRAVLVPDGDHDLVRREPRRQPRPARRRAP